MTEPTNEERGEFAYRAITAFAQATGQDKSGDLEHELELVISDFLADLMHMCDLHEIDFEACVRRGQGHYKDEVIERAGKKPQLHRNGYFGWQFVDGEAACQEPHHVAARGYEAPVKGWVFFDTEQEAMDWLKTR